jgi:hypothetical protein
MRKGTSRSLGEPESQSARARRQETIGKNGKFDRQIASSRGERPERRGRAPHLSRDILHIFLKEIGRILNTHVDAKLFGQLIAAEWLFIRNGAG